MNQSSFITRDQLAGWLDALVGEARLIAPRWEQGVLLYRPVTRDLEMVWEFTRPALSAKEFFFPPTERLLTIEKTGQQIKLTETLPEGWQVIFGIRPCEARGLRHLDALFLEEEPRDPYYARRRENTALIGLACKEMGATCFCTSLGGAPDDSSDVDVMLTEVDGGYLVQVVTEKGRMLITSCDLQIANFKPASDSQSATRNLPPPLSLPSKDTWPAHFNDEYWERMSERCLSCRLCAYVCPTCRCFDVRDEALGEDQYERIRCWDSCAGVAYRRIAGGHNPRAAKGERLRNRFLCKFYYYPQQVGLDSPACTGCGRCIDLCPVNIDITEVLGYLVE